MRRLVRPALLLLLVAAVTLAGIAADKAKDLYAKGQDAEARQNHEAAYEFYKQAYDLKPKICATGHLSSAAVFKPPPPSFTTVRSCATTANSTKPWLPSKKRWRSILPSSSPSRSATAPSR